MPIIFLILNILLLAAAFVTGIFLFLWIALIIGAMIIYLWLYRKLTGRPPSWLHVYTFRHTERSGPPIIDAEYRRIDEK